MDKINSVLFLIESSIKELNEVNKTEYRSREISLSITKLEEAQMWLERNKR